MKTIALPLAGLAVWLAFLFPAAPALGEETVTEERAEEMFLDYTALAQRCWPDLHDEQSPLFRRTIELYRATPTTPDYEWLSRDPRRSFFLAKIAADQLGIVAVPGTPVLEMKPIHVRPAEPEWKSPADRLNISWALSEASFPDSVIEGTPLYNQISILFAAAETMPQYQWILGEPEWPMILAEHAARQLGIPATPADQAGVEARAEEIRQIKIKESREAAARSQLVVPAAAPAPVVVAPPVQAPNPARAGLSTAELIAILEREDQRRSRALTGRTEPDPEQEALDSARVRQRVMESRLAEIQRQLRKLERR
jgi:hypothetical protein